MKNQDKVNQIVKSMTSFQKKSYSKNERLEELFNLQSEVVKITFPEKDDLFTSRLRLWDALNYLKAENTNSGCKANTEIKVFERDCSEIGWRIAAEVAGNKGEEKVYRRLQYKECPGIILRNLELSLEDKHTELDTVVITDNAIFIIEVKNTNLDVYIDEVGDQYKVSNHKKFDSKLGTKMIFRKQLVQQIANVVGLADAEIINLVCFTNSCIKIDNRCDELQTCTLGKLPYFIIEYQSQHSISVVDQKAIAEALTEASNQERYPMDYNIEEFKTNFARAIVAVEIAKKQQTNLINRAKNFFKNFFKLNNTQQSEFLPA